MNTYYFLLIIIPYYENRLQHAMTADRKQSHSIPKIILLANFQLTSSQYVQPSKIITFAQA